jgi:putative ABC transport system permease protein
MVRALDRKLLRDLLRLKGQVVTIALVVACGVATFLTFVGAYRSLRTAEDDFYRKTRFAEVFATCVRAPLELEKRLAELPGVAVVETRAVANVNFDMPGYNEPIRGRLVSLSTKLNVPDLRSGALPTAPDEALVSAPFAKAHKLQIGSPVRLVLDGRERVFRVSGVAQSPEYVFAIQPGAPTVDDARFGVLWADRAAVAGSLGMDASFNDVTMRLAAGTSLRATLAAVDQLLAPYGATPTIGRDEQMSHRFIKNELAELRMWAIILPTIFVGVAAFLLNIVLARLVGTQREQIAALKAFGYGNASIAAHYLQMVASIVVLGCIAGTGLGWFLGAGMTSQYRKYFRFPTLEYRLEGSVVIAATLITFAIAAFGAYFAIRAAVRLSPAEAMQPPAPARFRRSMIERVGLGPLFSNIGRIVVRNLSRRPLRSLASIVGIAFATAIVVVGLFFGDAIDRLIKHQFGRVMRDDITVVFRWPVDRSSLTELQHVPGVLHVEGVRTLQVSASFEHREKKLLLTALPADSVLRKIRHQDGTAIELPRSGIVLTTWLAETLGVNVGDTLHLELLDETHEKRDVRVALLVDETFGQQAYMQIDALNALLGEQPTVTGALLQTDARQVDATERGLKALPAVVMLMRRAAILASFKGTTGGWMLLVSSILSGFAATIAFGVVYNTARINLAERERELASLRVLGFTVGEITTIFAGELGALLFAGISLGFLVGRGITWGVLQASTSEGVRFPLFISGATHATAALVVASAGVISALIVRRKLDRLDLVGVLKTRD